MFNAHRWLAGSASLVLVVAWGCGDGPPAVTGSKAPATVKGTVTVNGKLATSGSVVFDPANAQRQDLGPVTAAIGKDGSYSLKTYAGPNRVTVSGNELVKLAPEIQYERLSFDAKEGENTYDIQLPTKK